MNCLQDHGEPGLRRVPHGGRASDAPHREDGLLVCRYLGEAIDRQGLRVRDVAAHFNVHPHVVGRWTARDGQAGHVVPTVAEWGELKRLLVLDGQMDAAVRRLNERLGGGSDYERFLEGKRSLAPAAVHSLDPAQLHPELFPFQRDLVRWALRKGRAALFADTGLGKSFMQLEWARHAAERSLILAPLSVAQQTEREGARWGIPVTYARSREASPARGITVTNYEMMRHFDVSDYGAVVLDESSLLKALDGKTRQRLTEAFAETPMRLCCTATPAPNDIAEIANHAEFLGIMPRPELLAAFFIHDDEGWRLKGHAQEAFYRWLASWGMSVKRPSDLGYSDEGYCLPPLSIRPHWVEGGDAVGIEAGGRGITGRAALRKVTLAGRVQAAAELICRQPERPWIAWVGLNDEGRSLHGMLPGSLLVEGQQSPDQKAAAVASFLGGEARVMISKPSIAGFGLNLQCCSRMVFVGLSDSFESYYQCIRRCWRFGQQQPVEAHIVLSDCEGMIYENVLRKEQEAERMSSELLKHVAAFESAEIQSLSARDEYRPSREMGLPSWI